MSNVLSFRERQDLSLVVSSLKDRTESTVACPAAPGGYVLPAVLIYGANASGKSNLLNAMAFMRHAILRSQVEGKPEGGVPRRPFVLDKANAPQPSRWEIDFVIDGIRYHYGFEASDEVFVAEWLYSFPRGRPRLLFERDEGGFRFGRALRGRNSVISDLTRSNSLFLSAAAQNGHEQLVPVFGYFRSMNGISEVNIESELVTEMIQEDKIDERVINFLKMINTGVVDYRSVEVLIPDEVKSQLKAIIEITGSKQKLGDRRVAFELAHLRTDGESVYFDLDQESAGTRRLLVVLGPIFHALDQGTIFVIDELDSSLHTQAAESILALFCSPETNPKGAQLITTTHNTNLLDSKFLRRDQVWFTEKDSNGATELFSLTDFRPRKGSDVERAYLEGRFGAIPSDNMVMPLG